jgi:hypothetical protein
MSQVLVRQPASVPDRVESSLGAFFASVVVLMTGGVVTIVTLLDRDVTRATLVVTAVAAAFWLALDVPYAMRLWLCVHRRFPRDLVDGPLRVRHRGADQL